MGQDAGGTHEDPPRNSPMMVSRSFWTIWGEGEGREPSSVRGETSVRVQSEGKGDVHLRAWTIR